MGHGYDQMPIHKCENQREMIERSVGIISRFTGKRPLGWLGPGLTQTLETPEFLAEAGVKVGLARDVATLLAAQTMKGAASVVLETGDHPALLKDAVTTPAGCTIDGILELEEGKLRVTLIKAVVKATSRAGELLFESPR